MPRRFETRRRFENLRTRNARMMALYFDEGWSQGALAKEFGFSEAFVRKLIRTELRGGRVRRKQGRSLDPRRRENRRPLSRLHALIGVRVAAHRQRIGATMADFGARVGLSRPRIGALEAGAYDPTLLELHRIAAELGMTVLSLVALAEPPMAYRRACR